jgi:hypothetical protein
MRSRLLGLPNAKWTGLLSASAHRLLPAYEDLALQGQLPDASCCTTEASTLHDDFRSLTSY